MSTKQRQTIMGAQHDNIKYLQGDDIGGVISKGLADTYSAYPANPIEYFGKWLLNYNKTIKAKASEETKASEIVNLKKKREEELNEVEKNRLLDQKAKEEVVNQNDAFWKKLDDSEDLNDNLSELTNYIHRNIKATGVYIGQLEPPMKQIEEDAGD